MLVLDINNDLLGDVTADFREYSQKDNQMLIENIFRSVSIDQGTRLEIVEKLVKYPDESICVEHLLLR